MASFAPHVRAGVRQLGRVVRLMPGIVWMILFLILLALFLKREQGEVWRIWAVVRAASVWWVLAAIAGELIIIGLMAWLQGVVLRRLRQTVGWRSLMSIYLQREVAATVVPFGGPSSLLLAVRLLGNQGVSTPDAMFAALLSSIVGVVSFVLYLVPVLLWLIVDHASSLSVIIAALLLLAVTAALLAGLYLGLRPAGPPAWFARLVPARLEEPIEQARGHGVTAKDLALPLAIAVAGEIISALVLYACLVAVGHHPSPPTVLAGYAVGTLFLLVAPLFRGIGFVELGMAVTLSRFGVPSAAALAAALLFRFCELWLPLVLGIGVQAGSRPEVRKLPPHLPAMATGFTGLLTVLSVLAPRLPRELNRLPHHHYQVHYDVFAPANASRTVTLIAGFLLIFLSYSLWRRKRVAWLIATALLAATVFTHLLKEHDQVVSLFAAVNVLLLLAYRRRFRVRSDVPTMRLGMIRFGASLLFALLYGTLGFWLLDRRAFGINFTVIESIERTIGLFFSMGNDGLAPRTEYADWFLDSLNVVGVLSVAYALFSLLRPVVWRRRTLPTERARARHLIETYGDSSLDFFKTWPDKVFFFSSTGKGVVAYAITMSTAIALGDPVATDETEFQTVLAEFLDFCDANGWRAAFHQVPPGHLADYREAGLGVLKIGEEAVVHLPDFSLRGTKMKSLRAVVNRFEREGLRSAWYPPPLGDALLGQVRAVSDEWLTLPGRRERGFTLGQFVDDYVRLTPIMTVEDADGHILAFANVIPDGADGEATIDLMRHRASLPNGVMDFLFIRLLEHFKEAGYSTFSLGMAPFAE
ncbi:MAG TPA: phosphatidylglycerol lysyltransferase domain-containing protein, partial [Thermomicrobiales bacterium]|nr:phosphatidylglycerol lysyltransferase domain-containing protein [Thermomicrobiales bacterium]